MTMLDSLALAVLAALPVAQDDPSQLLADIRADGSSAPRPIARVGARAFFHAGDGTGRYLFATDGTPLGTRRLDAQLGSTPAPIQVAGVPFEGRLLLTWAGGLAESDGTEAGTRYVVQPGAAGAPSEASDIAVVGDTALFLAADADGQGEDLWITDGTAAGTLELVDLPAQLSGTGAEFLGATPEYLAFTVKSGGGEVVQLWLSDGTAAGTQAVPGATLTLSFFNSYHLDEERLWFYNGSDASRLWISDGTVAGTQAVPGLPPTGALNLTRVRNDAIDGLFTATFSGGESGIWFIDAHTLRAQPTAVSKFTGLQRNASAERTAKWALAEQGDGLAVALHDLGAGEVLGEFSLGQGFVYAYHLPGSDVAVFSGTTGTSGASSVVRTDGTEAGTSLVGVEAQFGLLSPQSSLPVLIANALLLALDSAEAGLEPHTIPIAALESGMISEFESGCADTALLTASGAPDLGASVELRLADGVPGQLGVLTLSRTLLPPPAVGSCSFALLAFNQLGVFALDGAGDYATAVGVPINAALIGESVGLQAVMLEIGGPLFGLLETSNAIEVVIGA